LINVEEFGFELTNAMILLVEIIAERLVSHELVLMRLDEGAYNILEPLELLLRSMLAIGARRFRF